MPERKGCTIYLHHNIISIIEFYKYLCRDKVLIWVKHEKKLKIPVTKIKMYFSTIVIQKLKCEYCLLLQKKFPSWNHKSSVFVKQNTHTTNILYIKLYIITYSKPIQRGTSMPILILPIVLEIKPYLKNVSSKINVYHFYLRRILKLVINFIIGYYVVE